jgi:hypothetical protein
MSYCGSITETLIGRSRVFALGIVLPLIVCSPPLQASLTSISITSVASNWLVSGAGGSDDVPFQTTVNHLSITSDQTESGTFIAGGSLSSFDGFWEATETFFLPLNATAVSLSFAGFSSDDRAVLELNGVVIGDSGNGDPGSGDMTFTDGGALQPFNFTNRASGTISTGFNLGATNSLEVIVNNTGVGILGATSTFTGTADNTFFKISSGAITYNSAPEPASAVLVWSGCAAMLLASVRRRIMCRRRGPAEE